MTLGTTSRKHLLAISIDKFRSQDRHQLVPVFVCKHRRPTKVDEWSHWVIHGQVCNRNKPAGTFLLRVFVLDHDLFSHGSIPDCLHVFSDFPSDLQLSCTHCLSLMVLWAPSAQISPSTKACCQLNWMTRVTAAAFHCLRRLSINQSGHTLVQGVTVERPCHRNIYHVYQYTTSTSIRCPSKFCWKEMWSHMHWNSRLSCSSRHTNQFFVFSFRKVSGKKSLVPIIKIGQSTWSILVVQQSAAGVRWCKVEQHGQSHKHMILLSSCVNQKG